MERVEILATTRNELGKGPSRRVRREGLLPAVVYGPRMKPQHVALDPMQLKRALATGENVLVDLRIKDGSKSKKRLVMVKDYQLDPMKDFLTHVDLYEVSLKESIDVEVTIALTGDPEGVKYGGILSPLLRALEISCLPDQIPESFEVDCSSLNIGDTIHVSDITVPEGIRIRTDPSIAVVTVSAPEAEVVEEPEEAEEEELEEAAAEEEESPQED